MSEFSTDCVRCPRLAGFLQEVRRSHPRYHARPVASFGDPAARLLIVGLAPGLHGANRTGRPFTGDYAGELLYATLHKYGFADRAVSEKADDGLKLIDCRITNAVRCVPPQNRPTTDEVRRCNHFLKDELRDRPAPELVLALGTIAHNAVLRALGLKLTAHGFAHGAVHELEAMRLVDSYHCSRYNTNTRRLTTAMFEQVFSRLRTMLET